MTTNTISLVDSHCHLDRLDLSRDDGQLQSALLRARDQGVQHMLCVSIDMETWPSMCKAVEQFDQVSVSVGVHPNEQEGQEPTVATLTELAQHPRVVAIGETGLDYFRSEGDLDWQRERFRRHIAAAKLSGKPLIIHFSSNDRGCGPCCPRESSCREARHLRSWCATDPERPTRCEGTPRSRSE